MIGTISKSRTSAVNSLIYRKNKLDINLFIKIAMTTIEIDNLFHSVMKGNVLKESSSFEKLSLIKKSNCKTELLTQVKNYGKLE